MSSKLWRKRARTIIGAGLGAVVGAVVGAFMATIMGEMALWVLVCVALGVAGGGMVGFGSGSHSDVPISAEDINIFHQSLTRCFGTEDFPVEGRRIPDFIDRFYELFVASSTDVREKFEDTDFDHQKRMLHASLYSMYMAVDGNREAIDHLQRVAQRHSHKEMNIDPSLYQPWQNCLLQAASEHDPEFSAETERVWRAVLKFGVEFMVKRY